MFLHGKAGNVSSEEGKESHLVYIFFQFGRALYTGRILRIQSLHDPSFLVCHREYLISDIKHI
jgi:hypothetical protein